jgi:signal transduction histidine kinase
MQERVRLVNGTLSIESVPGKGTTIRMRLPLRTGPEKRTRDSSASRVLGIRELQTT